jgi:hypothetical protein
MPSANRAAFEDSRDRLLALGYGPKPVTAIWLDPAGRPKADADPERRDDRPRPPRAPGRHGIYRGTR